MTTLADTVPRVSLIKPYAPAIGAPGRHTFASQAYPVRPQPTRRIPFAWHGPEREPALYSVDMLKRYAPTMAISAAVRLVWWQFIQTGHADMVADVRTNETDPGRLPRAGLSVEISGLTDPTFPERMETLRTLASVIGAPFHSAVPHLSDDYARITVRFDRSDA